jgi:hypothetical protein
MIPTESLLQSLNEMLDELEPYLLSPALFWPINLRGSGIPQDRLTLGNLLLCIDQLLATRESWDLQTEANFRRSELQWEQEREKWKSAIGLKTSKEIGSRLNLWRAYLMDLDDGQMANFDYRHEVRNRVIIERLLEFCTDKETWEKDLQNADRLLRSLVVQSEFIWAEQLRPMYPSKAFWFLYKLPRKQD